MAKQNVLVIAELDWDGLHCQSHVMALGFAKKGHSVFYINRTLQKWPKFSHLKRRLKKSAASGDVSTYAKTPENIHVITLWLGPPIKWLRPINRFLIKRGLKNHSINNPTTLIYTPTYNAIDICNYVNPKSKSYICYHNFDASDVPNDLLKSEKEIINTCDVLFADSAFLKQRLEKINTNNTTVERSMPGVYYSLFNKAERGNETKEIKTIYFFGGFGKHCDLEIYNTVAEKYNVVIIGVVDAQVKDQLHPNIEVKLPVSNKLLPDLLKEADVLSIFYKNTPYIQGVIPAKFFECMATGKPVLVSGLNEAIPYNNTIYSIKNGSEAIETLATLPTTFNEERKQAQLEIAKSANWENRFEHLYSTIDLKHHEL